MSEYVKNDIKSCIRSCQDRAMAIKDGETKWAWGKGQKKRAYELEMMKIKVLQDLLDGELAEVVHAQWVGIEGDGYDDDGNIVYDVFECSNCGCEHRADGEPEWTYCPDCGAKMDLEV